MEAEASGPKFWEADVDPSRLGIFQLKLGMKPEKFRELQYSNNPEKNQGAPRLEPLKLSFELLKARNRDAEIHP